MDEDTTGWETLRTTAANGIVPRSKLIWGLASALVLIVASIVILYGLDVSIIAVGDGQGIVAFSLMLQMLVWSAVFIIGCICGNLWPHIFLRELPVALTRSRRKPSMSGWKWWLSFSLQTIVLIMILLFFYVQAIDSGYSSVSFITYSVSAVLLIGGWISLIVNTSFFSFIVLFLAPVIYILYELSSRVI